MTNDKKVLHLVGNEYANIQKNIAKEASKVRSIDLSPKDIGHDLFILVARAYLETRGELPVEWEKYMQNCIRYTNLLLENGHTREDLEGLNLIELRDLCNEHEYVEVVSATATGGKTTTRTEVSGRHINTNASKAA